MTIEWKVNSRNENLPTSLVLLREWCELNEIPLLCIALLFQVAGVFQHTIVYFLKRTVMG